MYTATAADLMNTDNFLVCVPVGPASGTFNVTYYSTVDDDLLEAVPNEEFQLQILGTIAAVNSQAMVTIIDNDDGRYKGIHALICMCVHVY